MPNNDDDDIFLGNSIQLGSSKGPVLRSKTSKRDSFAAELERDPQLANAKRAHKTQTQVFTSSISHAALERQILTLKSSKLELETKLRDREGTIERLERDRRWFADREVTEKDEREKERSSWEEEKAQRTSDIHSLRTSLASLTEAHAELEDTHSALLRTTSHASAQQKVEVDTLTHRTIILEDELSSVRKSLDQREATLADLQAKIEKLTQADNEEAVDDSPEGQGGSKKKKERAGVDKIIQDELHRQTSYLRQLESANANLTAQVNRLRERNASVAVLQEEKRSLESRLTQMEELRGKVGRLERELEAERARSKATHHDGFLSSSSSSSLGETTAALASLRLAHAQLLSEHGATRAELAAVNTRLEEAQILEERLAEAEMVIKETGARAKRAEEKTLLEESEGKFLRALVASYTAESQACIDMSVDGDTRATPSQEKYAEIRTHTEAQAKHIAHLEVLLGQYKASNAKLSSELDAVGGDASALLASGVEDADVKEVRKGKTREMLIGEVEKEREKVKECEDRLKSAESNCVAHLAQIENLEQELFELKGEVAGGRHVPPGVRVLQLRDNPESQWVDMRREVVERLRKENDALLKRLKDVEARAKQDASAAVEEGHGGENTEGSRVPKVEHEDLVPRESWDLLNKEKLDLEDVVKQKEKRLLRLKEVFNAKGAEFRDAIASILGVKLVFKPNGQVRVTSIYDLNASFVFQPTASGGQSQVQGTMQLVAQGDGGPQDLPNLMHFWVQKEQCIPGFVASVTLECYENAKRNDVH